MSFAHLHLMLGSCSCLSFVCIVKLLISRDIRLDKGLSCSEISVDVADSHLESVYCMPGKTVCMLWSLITSSIYSGMRDAILEFVWWGGIYLVNRSSSLDLILKATVTEHFIDKVLWRTHLERL